MRHFERNNGRKAVDDNEADAYAIYRLGDYRADEYRDQMRK